MNYTAKMNGDKVLANSLKIMKRVLPSNAIFYRIGGDEFGAILPDATKIEANKYIKEMTSNLAINSILIHGVTVSMACEDSSKGTLHHISQLTENRVSQKKQKNQATTSTENLHTESFLPLKIPNNISEEESKTWNKLNLLINKSISEHLRDLRPSELFRYSIKDFKTESDIIIHEISNLLEKNLEDKAFHIEYEAQKHIPIENAEIIHSLIFNKKSNIGNLTDNQLSSLSESLNALSETLIRDNHSGLLSKSYYKLYLAQQLACSNSNYQAVYFSLSGIRASNTAYSHQFTDLRIEKSAQYLITEFSKKRCFNNNSFEFNKSDAFLIDQGGGNYLALIPSADKLSKSDIDEIVKNINDKSNQISDIPPFQMACTYLNNVNANTIPSILSGTNIYMDKFKTFINKFTKNNSNLLPDSQSFIRFARYLKGICGLNKDSIKHDSLNKFDNSVDFRKSIQAATKFYVESIPDAATNIEKKSIFLENVFISLVNQENYYNTNFDNKETELQNSVSIHQNKKILKDRDKDINNDYDK